MQPRNADFFTYSILFATFAAATTPVGSFNIDQEADFEWMYSSFFADIAGGAQTNDTRVLPLVTVNLSAGGAAARPLQNIQVPITSLFGDGMIPFRLPQPKILKAGQTLTAQITNVSAATSYRLWLNFVGRKLFKE